MLQITNVGTVWNLGTISGNFQVVEIILEEIMHRNISQCCLIINLKPWKHLMESKDRKFSQSVLLLVALHSSLLERYK